MKFAVALAGGGARGAYQVGALKALLEMDIEVTAVAGTSIGSINAALFAQGDIEKAYELWQSITIEKVITLTNELAGQDKSFNIKKLLDFSVSALNNRGVDVTPLKELLWEIIDEERLRSSPIDFGLTTFSVTDRSAVEMWTADVPCGKMVDYLLASSCFPGFALVEIDGREFIDGGVTNNMPVSMLVNRGFKDIVAIDIRGLGVMKKFEDTGLNIITVKNNRKLTGFFEFDKEKLDRSIQYGYMDTCKAFGKVKGRRYYYASGEYDLLRSRYSLQIISGLEHAAGILALDDCHIYKAGEFIDAIVEEYRSAQTRYGIIKESLQAINVPELLKNRKDDIQLTQGVILPFLVDLLTGGKESAHHALLKRLAANEFLAAGSIIYMLGAELEQQGPA